MRIRLLGSAVFLAACLGSASVAAADKGPAAAAAAESLLGADRAFAAAAAKADAPGAISAAFADDVIMPMRGKGFARGKAAAIEALRANPGTATARVEWIPIGVGASADGSQGFTFGFMTEHASDGQQTPLKYLAYWRHDDGGWRVVAYKRGRRPSGPVDPTLRPPLLAASHATSASASDHARTLAAAEREFSDAAQTIGLAAAFAQFGTAESMNLGGADDAGFVYGADSIARLVGQGEPEKGSRLSWASDERVVVAASGDLGVSIGHIRFNQRAEDGSERPPIPFFTVWRRAAPEQPWRYVAE